LGGKTDFHTWDYAFYVEDSFKPAPSVTVNFGLRYDLQTMPGLTGNPDIPATTRINTDKNNFGPRVGLAWDVFGKQKTVIRAGAGAYYGRTENSTLVNLITNNGVRFKSYSFIPTTAGSPVFPNVLSAVPTGAAGKPSVVFASNDFANPLIFQMEFGIEQEVFKNFTMGAVYMGSRGEKLPMFRDINLFPPSQATYSVCGSVQVGSSTACSNVVQTFTVPFFTGARPNPNYGQMTVVESTVNSWYHGLVLQAKQRFSHGFQMQAAFTFSKAIDNGQTSTTFTAANVPLYPYNIAQDKSLSDFDQRKRFTVSALWQPSFSWIDSKPLRAVFEGFQFSGILALADGRPYSGSTNGKPLAERYSGRAFGGRRQQPGAVRGPEHVYQSRHGHSGRPPGAGHQDHRALPLAVDRGSLQCHQPRGSHRHQHHAIQRRRRHAVPADRFPVHFRYQHQPHPRAPAPVGHALQILGGLPIGAGPAACPYQVGPLPHGRGSVLPGDPQHRTATVRERI